MNTLLNHKWATAFSVLAALLMLALPQFMKNYGIYLLSYWLVFIIATMGLNLTIGYAGQKSLGHAAFFGIGAYTVAILMKAGVSFWLGLPAAIVAAPSHKPKQVARVDEILIIAAGFTVTVNEQLPMLPPPST